MTRWKAGLGTTYPATSSDAYGYLTGEIQNLRDTQLDQVIRLRYTPYTNCR
ncbi:predicted protein [Sclerotinia sclerotiorum 1980 UF-70]|uniref:Uncharacterized protein n=1 Tax=Sclerotinia sclerotiorum (strain ATCC 18683 / 1980 / Ss-1) TaxID=665079 RepID=A7EY13_SCLS1|nr:predicted protein [Sclerotinia sclerotiorum 1980 UF-70]EDN94355.1 predicted protein [Sclerotinia sclerotiorum 1980 UF-70]